MERWRKSWRLGFAPQFTTPELIGLLNGIRMDDVRLLQANTCFPFTAGMASRRIITAGCAVVYAKWSCKPFMTIEDADDVFEEALNDADKLQSQDKGSCEFMAWWDHMPRDIVFKAMAEELVTNIAERQSCQKLQKSNRV